MKRLVILSDTKSVVETNGFAVFEPPLREIESISTLFRSVNWITYLYASSAKQNVRLPVESNIVIRPMSDYRGGSRLWDKFRVAISVPIQLVICCRWIARADVVHTRGPSVPALIGILISFVDTRRLYWHKYAGNWGDPESTISYRLQKALLLMCKRKNVMISVNGKWSDLHAGFVSYENPCVEDERIISGSAYGNQKQYEGKLRICFVGTLDDNKGVLRLARAILSLRQIEMLDSIHIVGDGSCRHELESLAKDSPVPFHIYGELPRQEIFDQVYASSHLLVLPSITEGFPKVVAEAAVNYCIPVVTRMSSLDQYIQHGVNGYLLNDSSSVAIERTLANILLDRKCLPSVAAESFRMASLFTYKRFRDRISNELLGPR